MNIVKSNLLSFGIFIDNEFLDKYIDLINSNINTEKIKFSTQAHHIIPRCYYSYNNLDIDNSKSNLVNLVFSDHILAHYYLSLCCNGIYKYNNEFAFLGMSGRKSISIDEKYLIQSLPYYDSIYKEAQKHNSELHLGKVSPIKGKKCPERSHETSKETRLKISAKNSGKYTGDIAIHLGDNDKHVKQELLSYYIELGYQIGRSDKYKKSLSNAYNYESKGMLGKSQSDFQKLQVSKANSHPRDDSSKQKQKETLAKNKDNYVYMRNKENTGTARVKKENIQKYLEKGFTICNKK